MSDETAKHDGSPLDEALGRYMERIDQGEHVDRDRFIAEHADVANELTEYFDDADALEKIAHRADGGNANSAAARGPGEAVRCFGDYELLEEIARGGMGVVFKARQRSLNRVVAVKTILAGRLASQQHVDRFRREAETAANLKHPNIVAIHEVGEHEGLHYFSMDFIEGTSLAEMVRENPLPPKKAAKYAKKIAETVYYAHQHGTLHRDIKPSNVLIDLDDVPHVTDFGLARQLESGSELTDPGAIMGSPSYMSPEQAAGMRDETVGPSSDVYSLGATLYDLLTGRPPFLAATPAATVAQVLTSDVAAPRRVNPAIDRDLETICLKCMEREPHRRYETAGALADDLDRYLTDRPILARPIGHTSRLWRWVRRNPMLATMAVLLVCVLLAGTEFARRQRLANQERERVRVLNNYVEAGFRARQQGELSTALQQFQEAIRRGHPETPGIRLARIDAYNSENRYDRIRSEVDQLFQLADLGEHRGAALLWRAELELLDGDDDQAIKHVHEALKADLSKADEAYARGLLATNCPAAVEQLLRATNVSLFHQRASLQLACNYLLLGKRDEARMTLLRASTLCPKDPNVMILLAMVEAFDGNANVARQRLDATGALHPDQRDILAQLIQLLDEFNRSVNNPTRTVEANPAWTLVQLFETAQPLCSPPSQDDGTSAATITIRFTPALIKRYRNLLAAAEVFDQEGIDQKLVSVLEDMVKVHPEGTLHFLLGQLHFVAGRYEQAEQSYGMIKDVNVMFPAIKGEARFGTMIAQAAHEFGEDEKKLKAAVATIREPFENASFSRLHSTYATMILKRAEEYDLAELVLSRAAWLDPTDVQLQSQLMDVALDRQAYALAIRRADDILRRDPNHGRAVEVRGEAIVKLRNIVGRAGDAETGEDTRPQGSPSDDERN